MVLLLLGLFSTVFLITSLCCAAALLNQLMNVFMRVDTRNESGGNGGQRLLAAKFFLMAISEMNILCCNIF